MCPRDFEGTNELEFMDTDETIQGGNPEEFPEQCTAPCFQPAFKNVQIMVALQGR